MCDGIGLRILPLSSSILAALLSVVAIGSPALATIIRVPSDQPTIQAALNVAGTGDIVLVAAGTYSGPGNRNLDFLGKDIILRSEAGAQATIIDCSAAGRAFHFHSQESSQAIVEGFTIQNAYAPDGGAFFIETASPSITDCVIRDNEVQLVGAAAYCFESSVSFTRCTISDNFAGFVGGLYFQLSALLLDHCTIERNGSRQGVGGIGLYAQTRAMIQDCFINSNGCGVGASESEITLTRCSFNSNRSIEGGALRVYECTILISECTFVENSVHDAIGATANGGAISSGQCHMSIERSEFRGNVVGCGDDEVRGGAIASGDLSLDISGCRFQDNVVESCNTPGMGGALSVAGPSVIVDSVFFRNRAASGSAIYCGLFGGSPLAAVSRCTFALNSSPTGAIHLAGGAALTAQQTIIAFSNKGAAVECDDQSSAILSCCDVFGGAGGDWTGCLAGQQNVAGNLALDPIFCDLPNGGLNLQSNSPCAPGNSGDCGLIGALPVDCGAQVVTPTTWGRVKSAFLR